MDNGRMDKRNGRTTMDEMDNSGTGTKRPQLLFFVFTLTLAFVAYSFYDRQFKLSNIIGNFPIVDVSNISKSNEEYLKIAFSQPFHYLDRGKQAYVFESQDKRYVLKFFDNRCLRSGKMPF